MKPAPILTLVTFLALLTAACLQADDDPEMRRNPFGVADVPVLTKDQIEQFRKSVQWPEDSARDPNAEDWTEKPVPGNPMFVDGEWFGRWNSAAGQEWQSGTAKIRQQDKRIFILYTERGGGATYLIEAVKVGEQRLEGAYVLAGTASAQPWVGRIVDGERIDGIWSSSGGRWDFRRKTSRQLPKTERPK